MLILNKFYSWLIQIGAIIVAIVAFVFLGKKWGKVETEKKQAQSDMKEMEKYEKIDSRPPSSTPMADILRMRKKN
jgi:H+/gluconate symporter-like permease